MVDGQVTRAGRAVGQCLICHRWTTITPDCMVDETGPVCHRCQEEKPSASQVRTMMVDRVQECRLEIQALERRIREHDEVHGA